MQVHIFTLSQAHKKLLGLLFKKTKGYGDSRNQSTLSKLVLVTIQLFVQDALQIISRNLVWRSTANTIDAVLMESHLTEILRILGDFPSTKLPSRRIVQVSYCSSFNWNGMLYTRRLFHQNHQWGHLVHSISTTAIHQFSTVNQCENWWQTLRTLCPSQTATDLTLL